MASRDRARRAFAGRPARRPPPAGGRSTGASRTSPTSRRRATNLQTPLRRPGQGLPGADRDARPRHVRRRRLPRLPVAVRHRRRVHGVRERRARPVRGDQGAPDRAARRLGRAQRPLRQGRARDRHRRLGLLRREPGPGQHRRVGQVRRAPSRSSGAGPATTASATTSTTSRAARCATSRARLDADKDGWPEGLGNVEREGMGEEKLDNAVYLIRGLYDLADMARDQRDSTTEQWAHRPRRPAARALRPHVVARGLDPVRRLARGSRQHPRSSSSTGSASRRWRPSCRAGGSALAPAEHAAAALAERESDCFSGVGPFNRGLFHTGCEGGPAGQGRAHDLLAQHGDQGGRRGQLRARSERQQQRYTDRQRRPDVRARRAARRAAGDPPVAGLRRHRRQRPQPRPLLDLPRDVHAGLGPLRHGLAGDPPATRRAPGARRRPARRSCRSCPTGQTRIGGRGDPARRRRRRGPRRAPRQPLHDDGDASTTRRSTTCASARRCRRASDGRRGAARRRARARARR